MAFVKNKIYWSQGLSRYVRIESNNEENYYAWVVAIFEQGRWRKV